MQHSRHQLGVKVRSPLAQREGFHIWFSSKTRCAWHDNKKQFKSICIFFYRGAGAGLLHAFQFQWCSKVNFSSNDTSGFFVPYPKYETVTIMVDAKFCRRNDYFDENNYAC